MLGKKTPLLLNVCAAMISPMNDEPNSLILRDGQTWYIVAHAAGMAEAEIIAGLLRSAKIPVFLLRESGSIALPMAFGLLGGVDIAVPEAYYAEATALLEGDPDTIDELPPETDEE